MLPSAPLSRWNQWHYALAIQVNPYHCTLYWVAKPLLSSPRISLGELLLLLRDSHHVILSGCSGCQKLPTGPHLFRRFMSHPCIAAHAAQLGPPRLTLQNQYASCGLMTAEPPRPPAPLFPLPLSRFRRGLLQSRLWLCGDRS